MANEEATVHFPSGIRWSCHNSGLCCRDFDIAALREDVQRIGALSLGEIDREFLSRSPFEESSAHPGRFALRLVDKRCCFLSAANLCRLHSAFGAEAKPLPCREFPFLFSRAIDGVYVGLSFVCPSVVANRGEPIEERDGWVRGHLPSAFAIAQMPETVELTEGLRLDWGDYLVLEDRLLRLLRSESIALDERLIAGNVWLGMLDLFLRQTQDEGLFTTREAIEKFAESMERSSYDRILRIARSQAHSPILQRMFLGMIIAFRNSLRARRGRLNAVSTILWNYFRHALRLGRIRLAPLEGTFRYSDFRRARFDPKDPQIAGLLQRYLTHMVFRKDCVRHGDLIRGYHVLLLAYALVRWYAVFLAAGRGSGQVGLEDVTQAVSLTERHYVAHSTFLELFERYPVLSGVFYSIVRRRNFAHSLVRPAV